LEYELLMDNVLSFGLLFRSEDILDAQQGGLSNRISIFRSCKGISSAQQRGHEVIY